MLELIKGTQLADRYTLDRRLGGGGEAQLWLAKDRLTAAFVALKVSQGSEVSGGAQIDDRLRREWQTQIRLMHAHIVRVFEFHSADGVAFYSQQFIDGPDLRAVAGMPLDKILAPIGLLADALRYVHGKGIVHRDVKASNVLLDHNGAPYLSDFGVAGAAGQSAAGGSLIAQSPQSLAGQASQPADDIFALGGLIYELVTGQPPYSFAAIAADISNKVPEPMRAVDGSSIPAALQDLVARMLDKDASKRPSAMTVTDELRAAGFEPGSASIAAGTRSSVVDEVIETVESIHPTRRTGDETALKVELPASDERRKHGSDRPGLTREHDDRFTTDLVVHRSIANASRRVRTLAAVYRNGNNDLGGSQRVAHELGVDGERVAVITAIDEVGVSRKWVLQVLRFPRSQPLVT
ncbi:MAG: serine/threonine protein kinase [Proteobacteria bacterium]|nr:serine/threonine protein kinase [Pseudomonadota bacterium]